MTSEAGPGQESFPEFALDEKHAFGRVPNNQYWDIETSELKDVDKEDMESFESTNLLPRLFRKDGMTSLLPEGILLNPQEFNTILRNPKHFERAVRTRIIWAKAMDSNVDRKNASTQRGYLGALRQKVEAMESIRSYIFKEENNLIDFSLQAQSPGFAHLSSVELRLIANNAWTLSFGNMLNVLAVNEGWDSQETDKMHKAFASRLLYAGPGTRGQRTKVERWQDTLSVAHRYSHARGFAFSSRLNKVYDALS